MKNEQVEAPSNLIGSDSGQEAGSRWAPGVTELLDHLAQELAIEYVRLMEQAAEEEDATPDELGRRE